MPTPYKSLIHDQLWTLLEAHAPFVALVKPGLEQKQTEQAGWLRDRLQRGVAEYPQVAIDNGRFTLSGYHVAETFATEAPGATAADLADAPIRWRCEFAVTITAKGLKSTDLDPVEEEAQIALLKGGPRLGLAFVVPPFGPLDARQQWIDATGNTTRKRTAVRLQSVLTLPILIEVPAATLTTRV
jgi:hypothetical protein